MTYFDGTVWNTQAMEFYRENTKAIEDACAIIDSMMEGYTIKFDSHSGIYAIKGWDCFSMIPKSKKTETIVRQFMNKVNQKDIVSTKLKPQFKKLDVDCAYFTSYGFAISAMYGVNTDKKDKIVQYLDSKNIDYKTEYSDKHRVYRFKISKSKENIEKIENL